MGKPSRQIRKPGYSFLVLLGQIKQSNGETVDQLCITLKEKVGIERKVSIYEMLQYLQFHGLVEKVPQHTGSRSRPRSKFVLTAKGSKAARRYNATIIASNPPLLTFEDLT